MKAKQFPLITIGLMTFNNQETIEMALKSLLEQDYPNFQLLIFDDKSTDSTLDIVKSCVKGKKNVVLVSNKQNLGIIKNLESMASKINTEYFLWACPDDYYHPSMLGECFHKIYNSKFSAVLPSVNLILEKTSTLCKYRDISLEDFLSNYRTILKQVLYRENHEQYCLYWHALMRTDVFKKLFPFNPRYLSIEEIFPLFLIMHGGIGTVDKVLWDKHQSSIPFEIRTKTTYEPQCGCAGKINCLYLWASLSIKLRLHKKYFFSYLIFKYIYFHIRMRVLSNLYLFYKRLKEN